MKRMNFIFSISFEASHSYIFATSIATLLFYPHISLLLH